MGSYDNSYTCSECGKGFSDPGGWQLPRLISEHMEKYHPPKPGPVTKAKKWDSCTGCPALYTEWWKDYLDNDDTDSGTAAFCLLMNNGESVRSITAYWAQDDPTPDWCPAK